MREIKFRAWDGIRITTSGIMFNTSNGHIEVPNGTQMKLMQYTGLLDKNGVEIYEGDIVKYMYRSWNTAGMGDRLETKVVEFKDGSFNCFTKDSFGVEVIGNIYENPELIEKK